MGKRKQNGLYIVSGVYFVNISLLIINQYGLFLHDQHILDGTVTNTGKKPSTFTIGQKTNSLISCACG